VTGAERAGVVEVQGWESPGFGWLFVHGLVRGVVGGVVLGVVYGGAFVWVWALTGSIVTWEPEGFLWLVLLPYGVLFGLLGGSLAGSWAGLLLGVVLGAWLASPGVRGVPVQRITSFARWIAGLLTAALVCVVMLNGADADGVTFLFVDLLPAVIAITYGAWTGGRLVQTGAIRMQREAEGRLPA
jgi:hypothetical protein